VVISRAGARVELPARFQLVTAMNPCPCGFRGHPRRACRCSPGSVERYRRRISGPLLDRIELRLELQPPELVELLPGSSSAKPAAGTSHLELTAAVRRGLALRSARQGPRRNADLSALELDEHAPLDAGSRTLLAHTAERRGLSARGLQALRRVARTVADLEGEPRIRREHLAEALAMRAEWP
jgi:magnesium chelatase family protein